MCNDVMHAVALLDPAQCPSMQAARCKFMNSLLTKSERTGMLNVYDDIICCKAPLPNLEDRQYFRPYGKLNGRQDFEVL